MKNHTCLYCETVLTDKRQRVCKEHFNHHRMVLHYKRRGRDINDRRCQDCGSDISHRSGNAKRCEPCVRKEANRASREYKTRSYGPKPSRRCENCGKCIGPERRRDARFCNRKCLEDYRGAHVDRSAYRKSTQEKRTAYTREWRKANPASVRQSKFKRRAHELRGSFSSQDWHRLLSRYGHKCAYCSNDGEMTVDHVVPLSRGGTNTIGNILPACRSCNGRKHARFITEWKLSEARLDA